MDFRAVDPASLVWFVGDKGPVARCAAKSVRVQTPVCACAVTPIGSGMFKMELRLDGPGVRDEFAQWVRAVETSASGAEALAGWRETRASWSGIFRGRLRLTTFADTLALDTTGNPCADFLEAASCACLLELQGAWRTSDKWGLRWRVVQFMFEKARGGSIEEYAFDDC